jgi:hypothetical protein
LLHTHLLMNPIGQSFASWKLTSYNWTYHISKCRFIFLFEIQQMKRTMNIMLNMNLTSCYSKCSYSNVKKCYDM